MRKLSAFNHRVFSMEREQGGRLFLCAALQRFWSYYEALPPPQRHHYEILRAGCPCHLYFGE